MSIAPTNHPIKPGSSGSDPDGANNRSGDKSLPTPKKWTRTRMIVLGAVSLLTLVVLVVGISWGYYRSGHTVIDNATVKGRVHKIGARIDGQIESVEVQPGQRIVKDQVLIRLTDDHYQAAVRAAQSQLQSALKRFDAEKLAIEHQRRLLPLDVERCESLCTARQAEVKADISARGKWKFERDRVASLVGSGIASVSELDNATTERDSSAAQVETAQANLAAAESDLRTARVHVEGLKVREAGLEVLAADAELARQQLAVAQADLAATVIRAPDNGWVIDCIVQPGGSAKVGEPMMSLWLGAPWIEAWVDEKKLAAVKVGSVVDVIVTAFPDHKLLGRVEAIGVLADKELQAEPVPATLHSLFSNNAMVPIHIAVPNDELRLQPGLSALVGISHRTSEKSPEVASGEESSVLASSPPVSPRDGK